MNIMNFKYVRVQGKELAKNTMYAKGIFSMCWQLIQQDVMTGAARRTPLCLMMNTATFVPGRGLSAAGMCEVKN